MTVDPIEIAAELWRNVLEYVPMRDRDAAAEQFIVALRGLNFSDDELDSLAEHDRYINTALIQDNEENDFSNDDFDDLNDNE